MKVQNLILGVVSMLCLIVGIVALIVMMMGIAAFLGGGCG